MKTSRARALFACAALCAPLLASCFGIPEDRARQDESVGAGEAGGVAVRVVDGLAAVRELAAGRLVLWAQSPVLEIELTPSAAAVQEWKITVENALPDAELRAETSDGAPLLVTPTEEGHGCATHRAWTVRLIPGLRATLRVSSPDAEIAQRWSFAVLNDTHGADVIREAAPSLNANAQLRLVVSGGDLGAGNGRSDLLAVQEALCALRVPFYATVGNNDAGSTAWHDLFGRHSFHFAFRGVAFSFVDSASASVAPRTYEWFDDWARRAGARPHVTVTHVPPLDPLGSRGGGFRSREEAGKFLRGLAGGGVDLLLCGHLHLYYSLEEGGIPTVIGGAHGQHTIVDVDPDSGSIAPARVWSAAP